jgi:hypothetical protein
MRNPIIVGDHVTCTLIGDGPDGPFPYHLEAIVTSIHDDYLTVFDLDGQVSMCILRERVITDDQMEQLRKRFLNEDE